MSIFKFKFFESKQADSPMKVGTDAMVLGASIDVLDKRHGLDVGAGTGVLSLMCAQQNTSIEMDAVELDELASRECECNFSESIFSERLTSIHVDFLNFEGTKQYDLIISNPPFFQTHLENDDERKSNSRHERSLPKALFVKKVSGLLSPQGDFWIIVPHNDVKGWVETGSLNGLSVVAQINIRGKQGGDYIRSVLRFSKKRSDLAVTDFSIRCAKNNYTEAYIDLTRAFHFKTLKR